MLASNANLAPLHFENGKTLGSRTQDSQNRFATFFALCHSHLWLLVQWLYSHEWWVVMITNVSNEMKITHIHEILWWWDFKMLSERNYFNIKLLLLYVLLLKKLTFQR